MIFDFDSLSLSLQVWSTLKGVAGYGPPVVRLPESEIFDIPQKSTKLISCWSFHDGVSGKKMEEVCS